MKNSKRIIIILILILLFFMLCFLSAIIVILRKEKNTEDAMNTIKTAVVETIPKTIKDVIEAHNSEYISKTRNRVFLVFGKDLYDENGNSNESFFIDLVKDLDEFFPDMSFYLEDDEKNIIIFARRATSDNEITILVNNDKTIDEFYKDTNGRDYTGVETAKIVESSNLLLSNPYLERLNMNTMYFKYIEHLLSEGRELENGYVVYPEEKVKIKLLPNKSVFNLIFIDDYEDNILNDVTLKQSLQDIAEKHDDYVFGGLEKDYLGYRCGNFYYFFYEHEASIYSYSYKTNTNFEKLLSAYIEDGDLEKFKDGLMQKMKSYSELDYDQDIGKLYMTYPTRGIKIDIRDNNSKGITLYSNYNFTDTTRELVKSGKIQYNKSDYVNEYEQMRKEAE